MPVDHSKGNVLIFIPDYRCSRLVVSAGNAAKEIMDGLRGFVGNKREAETSEAAKVSKKVRLLLVLTHF